MWESLANEGNWHSFKERVMLAGGEMKKGQRDPDFGLVDRTQENAKIEAHRKRYYEGVKKQREAEATRIAGEVMAKFEEINRAKEAGISAEVPTSGQSDNPHCTEDSGGE